jgi:transposase InsO family protein
VLWTDNGGEFYGNEFEELCKKCGLERQTTTPYMPQHNGIAKRINIVSMCLYVFVCAFISYLNVIYFSSYLTCYVLVKPPNRCYVLVVALMSL